MSSLLLKSAFMVLGFYCEIYCFVDLERARNLAAFYQTAPKKKVSR